MRKLVVSMNLSLDGFMAGPCGELDWHLPFWNAAMSAHAERLLATMDTIVLGRITYETMAKYWPGAAPGDFVRMMNEYKKIVFSKSLKAPAWHNSTIAPAPVSEQILALKKLPGKNIVIYGSGTIVKSCMLGGLIDELFIWLYPLVLGSGRPMFNGMHKELKLRLLHIETFSSGVAVLRYERATPENRQGKPFTILHDCQTPDNTLI